MPEWDNDPATTPADPWFRGRTSDFRQAGHIVTGMGAEPGRPDRPANEPPSPEKVKVVIGTIRDESNATELRALATNEWDRMFAIMKSHADLADWDIRHAEVGSSRLALALIDADYLRTLFALTRELFGRPSDSWHRPYHDGPDDDALL